MTTSTSTDRYAVLEADERAILDTVLGFHRRAMVRKTTGLAESDLRWSPVPSGTSLLGLVHHLTRTEAWWFEGCLAGLPFDGDPRQQHDPPTGSTAAAVVMSYERQCRRSDEIAADITLDGTAANAFMKPSLRWILTHMIDETARHNGHADIIRELIDGATGE